MSRARAARRAARVTPSPVHEEAEVVVADFSDATDSLIGFGLPSSQRRRDGASDDDDSDTMDEDALETDTGDLLGDEADEKCGIIPLDVIDVESECIVCMNDKIEMRYVPWYPFLVCADCTDLCGGSFICDRTDCSYLPLQLFFFFSLLSLLQLCSGG